MTTEAQKTNEASTEDVKDQEVDKNAEETLYDDKKEVKDEAKEEVKEEEKKEDEKPETDEAKEEKKEDEKKDEKVVLKKEDIKVSKDSNLTDEQIDEIVKFSNEQGLSKEQAQAQLDREAQVRNSIQEGLKKALDEKVNEWTETSEKDKEFGGEKLKETQVRCNSLLKKHFSEEFVQTLIDTGYSNHPELIRGLNRIAKTMDADQLVMSSSQASSDTGKTAEDILYGDSDKNNN